MNISVLTLAAMFAFRLVPAGAGAQEPPAPEKKVPDVILEIKVISKVDPGYTVRAQRAQLSGTVLLGFVVGEDGIPRDIKVLRGLGMGLDERAIEALQRWTFSPRSVNGIVVSTRANVEMKFRPPN